VETLDLISSAWPIAVSFVTIVIVLAKLHANQETMAEKSKCFLSFGINEINKGGSAKSAE
jgi:hypothetical protein